MGHGWLGIWPIDLANVLYEETRKDISALWF
jgi:hypothetical protein